MHTRRSVGYFSLLFLSLFVASCASTGPKVSKAELKQKEEEFNLRFFETARGLLPKVYRVGYDLVRLPVPGHRDQRAKYNFIGVGVEELKDYGRKAYGIEKNVKGVLAMGVYPGSKAEGLDIRVGDVITAVNGKRIKNLGSYFRQIRKTEGKELPLTIYRGGQSTELKVPLEKVYYNAQFFIAPTPDFDANSLFSKIHVGIGSLRYCRNDDELAVIMGHELAHTTLRHSSKKLGAGISTGLAYGVLTGVIDIFTFPGVGQALVTPAAYATQAAISRRYEREADYYGMQHAFHSGYDVASGAKVFSRLATDAPSFEVLAYTFSSHPHTHERFLRLEKMVEEFKDRYPQKFPMTSHQDWEVTIPLEKGESIEEALTRLEEIGKQSVGAKPLRPVK